MIQIAIQEPKIEHFFNHSKDDILKALNYIVDNNITEFHNNTKNLELSNEQKIELNNRIESFHNNPSIGRTWNDIKSDISK